MSNRFVLTNRVGWHISKSITNQTEKASIFPHKTFNICQEPRNSEELNKHEPDQQVKKNYLDY